MKRNKTKTRIRRKGNSKIINIMKYIICIIILFLAWSDKEISALKKCFKEDITKRTYPSNQKIKDFMKQNKSNRSVPVIKSKIQHLIKLNSK